jgi:hypothetical protein
MMIFIENLVVKTGLMLATAALYAAVVMLLVGVPYVTAVAVSYLGNLEAGMITLNAWVSVIWLVGVAVAIKKLF